MHLTVDCRHLGTSESAWLASPRLRACPAMRWEACERVVVVAPHPDDEVFGVGGTLATLAREGSAITVVAVTDGEASHPNSRTVSRETLRARRAAERVSALARLAINAKLIRLGVPDGGVEKDRGLAARLSLHLDGADICLAPWESDGHPDHDAAGRAAEIACARSGVRLVRYLVWAWHWADPRTNDLPWSRLRRVALAPDVIRAKKSAVRAFRSQIEPLGPSAADEAILPPSVLARFERSFEVLIP